MAVDDAELLAAARRGDRAALDTLLRRHFDRVHALARRMMNNDADADDATQNALIAAVRGLPKFDGRSAFSTWLYRITTNACLDELRRRGRRPIPTETFADRPTTSVGVAELVTGRHDIDAALRSLPPEFRACVVLRDLCDLDYAEIASVLNIPAGTVRSRIARGRAVVAEAIGNPTDLDHRPSSEPS
jgi:RNA polymerase sigma-70 factor, ECF subfamily